MKVLGIHVAKAQLRYAVVSGTKDAPTLVDKGRLVTPSPDDVPALMDWFETQFRMLVDQHGPDTLAYRFGLDPKKKEQFITSEFPLGVFNLLAHRAGLPIIGYTPPGYKPNKLGMGKESDIYAACDEVFGLNPPYWDDVQKHAVLAAWFTLP